MLRAWWQRSTEQLLHGCAVLALGGSLQDTCADGASVGNRVGWRPELVCPNWTGSAHPLRSFVVQAEKRAAAEADPCGLSKWRCGPGAGLSGAGRSPAFLGSGPVPGAAEGGLVPPPSS